MVCVEFDIPLATAVLLLIYIHCQTPASLQKGLSARKWFFAVFLESTAFFEKPLKYKIFST